MTTTLYRIRRRNDTELHYLFIKADSPEQAAEQFARIAGTSVDESYDHHGTLRCELLSGVQIEVRETTVEHLVSLHPVIARLA